MRALACCAALAAAACAAPVPAPGPEPVPTQDVCGAAAYGKIVGRTRDQLPRLPARSRVLAASDPVTTDLDLTRLNVELDAQGRVARLACY